ncbi:MAG: fumarate/nitrate reduction transcriptional regulator Fnr [Gammaproteobacteria bacterium]|nr:fumarate/nitrate reduction transcriptional regulator Fnr [Gammaproteobacteria bacterium]
MGSAAAFRAIDKNLPIPINHRAASKNIERCPILCSSCNLRHLCLPCGMTDADAEFLGDLHFTRRHLKRGDTLYRAGASFDSLYAVRSGFFKSYAITEDGREQVTGFQMTGEIIGLDGIENDKHSLTIKALDDAVVCVIQFTQLEEMASRLPALQRQIHRLMSREIVRDQSMMMLLGAMPAEGRVTAFLLGLSQRFAARGYAASEFILRMTREEIGSYLGLKLETVSRVFSRLQQSGLIDVQQKHVHLRDMTGLQAILGGSA